MGLFFFAVARAEEALPVEHVRLLYTRAHGAEVCPDERELVAEVVARLGYDPFVTSDARTLEVEVTGDAAQLRAAITLVTTGAPRSTHRLVSSARDCSVLRPALGLAIALAIDPARALAVDVAEPSLPPPAPPRPFPRPTAEPAPLREPRTGSDDGLNPRTAATGEDAPVPRRTTLYGGGYAAVAAAPTTTGGIDVGAAAVWKHFSIGGELRGDMPVEQSRGTGRIEVGRVFVEGVPCFRTITFGFGICALAAVGLTIARGHGYVVSKDAFLPYVGLGARLMVEIPLAKSLAFGLHADVLGLVTRAKLRVDADTGYVDAPATGAFGIDFVGRFGDGS
jgi:hypothetical protein